MAKKSLINKANRLPKFKVRAYHRCRICGRPRGYLRKFAYVQDMFQDPFTEWHDSWRYKIKLVEE